MRLLTILLVLMFFSGCLCLKDKATKLKVPDVEFCDYNKVRIRCKELKTPSSREIPEEDEESFLEGALILPGESGVKVIALLRKISSRNLKGQKLTPDLISELYNESKEAK